MTAMKSTAIEWDTPYGVKTPVPGAKRVYWLLTKNSPYDLVWVHKGWLMPTVASKHESA